MVSRSVFFDLSRFYENVSHMAMKQAAVHYSFDLGLLRSLCALYRGPRRVRWMSATSRAIVPNGTVVAGCSCATGVVKLLTLCVLKAVALETPVCRPINLVDDVKLHAVGGVRTVAAQLVKAVNLVLAAMQQLELPVNTSKTCFMVSDHALLDLLLADPEWPLDVSLLSETHRDLGGDSLDGSRRRIPIQSARFSEALASASRLRNLGRGKNAFRVFRAGPAAKACWGAPVLGVSNSALRGLRVAAARSHGPLQPGSSLGFSLLFSSS